MNSELVSLRLIDITSKKQWIFVVPILKLSSQTRRIMPDRSIIIFKHSPYESRCLCFNGGWVMSSWTTWQIIDQSPYSFSQKQEFEQQRNLRSQFSLCCRSLLLLYTDLHNFADRWRKWDFRKIRSLRTNTLFRAVFTPFTKLKFLPHQRPSTKCNTCNTKDWGKVGVANSLLNKVEMVGDNASKLPFVILSRK